MITKSRLSFSEMIELRNSHTKVSKKVFVNLADGREYECRKHIAEKYRHYSNIIFYSDGSVYVDGRKIKVASPKVRKTENDDVIKTLKKSRDGTIKQTRLSFREMVELRSRHIKVSEKIFILLAEKDEVERRKELVMKCGYSCNITFYSDGSIFQDGRKYGAATGWIYSTPPEITRIEKGE